MGGAGEMALALAGATPEVEAIFALYRPQLACREGMQLPCQNATSPTFVLAVKRAGDLSWTTFASTGNIPGKTLNQRHVIYDICDVQHVSCTMRRGTESGCRRLTVHFLADIAAGRKEFGEMRIVRESPNELTAD